VEQYVALSRAVATRAEADSPNTPSMRKLVSVWPVKLPSRVKSFVRRVLAATSLSMP
jgi:hypothetical protein